MKQVFLLFTTFFGIMFAIFSVTIWFNNPSGLLEIIGGIIFTVFAIGLLWYSVKEHRKMFIRV
jgi:putative Ca2+/H+ antiporter (TMEM165/GDT1 family)